MNCGRRAMVQGKGALRFCDVVRQEEKLGKRIVMCRAIITRYVRMLRGCRLKFGCCTGGTTIYSNSPELARTATTWPRC